MLRDMLLTNQVHMAHMWYMPMIIGVYVCIPFAARALQGISLKVVFFPLLLFSAYAFGVPAWKSIFPKSPALVLVDLGFAGGVYGLYLLWGWRVKKGLFKNIHARIIGGCTVALFYWFLVLSLLHTLGELPITYGIIMHSWQAARYCFFHSLYVLKMDWIIPPFAG